MQKPTISSSFAKISTEQIMGKTSEFAPMIEGEESRVFSFQSGGEDYVVRINRTADGFEKDAFVHRKFAKPELPIPEVIAIASLENGYFSCISRRIPGVTLESLANSELPAILGPVAQAMDAIASSNLEATSGFGPFDASGVGRYDSWHSFLTSIAGRNRDDWDVARRHTDIRKIDKILHEFISLTNHCPEIRQLVHADFGSNNVLTDGHRITGVIDWSEALFGDPLYDVANILFWRTWLDCMEQQARDFESRVMYQLPSNSERLRCYQLRIGLEEIYASSLCGAAENVTWAISRCDEIIHQANGNSTSIDQKSF